MIAAIVTAPGRVEVVERDDPRPEPREVVVSVELAGVCGTDLAIVSGAYRVALPLVPGHEFVGRVVGVGDGVDAGHVGRRVTAEINNTCRAMGRASVCSACAGGLESHCAERTVTGIVAHDGAFAEQVRVPAANLHDVPDAIADAEAVFIEPLAAALEVFEMAPLEDGGDTVVVLGAGRLGYLVAGVARHLGAEVLVVDRDGERCERAREWLGVRAHHAVDAEGLEAEVKRWTGGLGAGRVVEATGSGDSEVLAMAARLVRPRGTIDLKSTPGSAAPSLPLTDLVVNEVRLQGSRCGPFDRAIELMGSRPFPIAELVAEEYPLRDAARAIDRAAVVSKVLIRCAR